MAKSPAAAANTLFLRPQWLVVFALTALLTYATPQLLDLASSLQQHPSSSQKPYADLASFRPRYMNDHRNETSVTLHVIGTTIVMFIVLANPELLGSGVLALKCGQLACALFRHHDTGLAEGAVVLVVFFLTTKFLGGSLRAAVVALFAGYFCAWLGHFKFEGNKPATFVYPTYSLVCDLALWFETITGGKIVF